MVNRGPLKSEDYRPHLSGHETFPLRYGWLKKVYDATANGKDGSVMRSDNAIAQFGVGKNMVASMRHWAVASGMAQDGENGLEPTPLAELIFSDDGLDPFMENPATLWLIHWFLAGNPERTTCFWAFNHYQSATFERDHLVRGISEMAAELNWKRAAAATIKRDVECFVRLYAAKRATARGGHEDTLESPLAELGLIRAVGRQDGFRFVRGAKPSLPNGIFQYGLVDFWQGYAPEANTLSFDAIAQEPGSPGRVFLLDEDDLFGRLQDISEASDGALVWSETTGLRQVIRTKELSETEIVSAIEHDYKLAA
jgi:hypothetical protein